MNTTDSEYQKLRQFENDKEAKAIASAFRFGLAVVAIAFVALEVIAYCGGWWHSADYEPGAWLISVVGGLIFTVAGSVWRYHAAISSGGSFCPKCGEKLK